MAGATNYPTSADDFATTSPSELGDSDSKGRTHTERHDDMEAAMEAVQASLLSGTGALNMTLQAGAAATPSLSFTGDLDTGVWSPAADTWAVATAGSERLRVGSTGNVSIGTTASSYKLDVNGTINSTALYVNGSAFRGGATGGGTDAIFYENDVTVTSDYTITTDKNAGSFGPITIDTGVTVTVPTGSVWAIV